MEAKATQYLLKCTRCSRRKTPPQVAPLQPIYVTQPLELVHMDNLSLEPSQGNIENVLVITDHFTRYALAYPSKTQTAQATARILWDNHRNAGGNYPKYWKEDIMGQWPFGIQLTEDQRLLKEALDCLGLLDSYLEFEE